MSLNLELPADYSPEEDLIEGPREHAFLRETCREHLLALNRGTTPQGLVGDFRRLLNQNTTLSRMCREMYAENRILRENPPYVVPGNPPETPDGDYTIGGRFIPADRAPPLSVFERFYVRAVIVVMLALVGVTGVVLSYVVGVYDHWMAGATLGALTVAGVAVGLRATLVGDTLKKTL